MRITPLLLLLPFAAAPVAAQGIIIPLACTASCPADARLPATMDVDTMRVWVNLREGEAMTHVRYEFRHDLAGPVDAAFFFPVPADAEFLDVGSALYVDHALAEYGHGSAGEESRRVAELLARERPDAGLSAYAGMRLAHVPLRGLPPGSILRLHIAYRQTLPVQDGAMTYRFPLSAGPEAASPGHLTVNATLDMRAGVRDVHSPSHPVRVENGMEGGRCRPEARCGWTSVPSTRVKEVYVIPDREVRARDFVLVYTPDQQRSASRP